MSIKRRINMSEKIAIDILIFLRQTKNSKYFTIVNKITFLCK